MLVSLTTLVQFTQYMVAVIDVKSVRLPHGRQDFVRPFGVALVPMQLSDPAWRSDSARCCSREARSISHPTTQPIPLTASVLR
jgi:hypothetical protein